MKRREIFSIPLFVIILTTMHILAGCGAGDGGASGGNDKGGSSLPGLTYTIGSDPSDHYASYAAFRAAHTEAAGNTISFRKGDIFRESITVPTTGTPGNVITYTSHGTGALPIIQPTTQLTSWTLDSGNIYYATLASAPKIVMIGDVYCRPAFWPSTVGNNPAVLKHPTSSSGAGTSYTLIDTGIDFDPTGAILHIYTPDNAWNFSNSTITNWDVGTHTLTYTPGTYSYTTATWYYLTGLKSFMSENTWWYDPATKRLYVWKTGGGSPGTVEAATSDNAFYCRDKQYITIDGIHFRYTNGTAVYFLTVNIGGIDMNDITVKNCTISYSASSGIVVAGTLDNRKAINAKIQGNTISYASSNPPTGGSSAISIVYDSGCTISGNIITNVGGFYPVLPNNGGGIIVVNHHTTGSDTPCPSCTGSTISGNSVSYMMTHAINSTSTDTEIHNNTVDHTNSYMPDGAGIYGWSSVRNVVSYNTLTGGTGYGIYNDTYTKDNIVEHNTVTGPTFGGALLHQAENITIRYNTFKGPFTNTCVVEQHNLVPFAMHFYYNIIDGVDNYADAFLFHKYCPVQTNDLSDIMNNVIMNCNRGVYIDASTNIGHVQYLKNNIFYNNTRHLWIYTGTIVDADYNLYYGTGDWRFGSIVDTTFAGWKITSSQDGNSKNEDPHFVSVSDFHLQSTSPGINAGVDLGLTTDYDGNPIIGLPDIGAYEFSR